MACYEKDQEYLQNLLDDIGLGDSDNEEIVFEDESDEEEQDNVELVNHQSDSEQEISDSEEIVEHPISPLVYIGIVKNMTKIKITIQNLLLFF